MAVDASDGRVAVDGWKRVLDLDAVALARDAAAAGAAAILYTDIARDGIQGGPNVWSTERSPAPPAFPCSPRAASARSTTSCQLAAIPGVDGAIVGRALYTGAVDLRRAQALADAS